MNKIILVDDHSLFREGIKLLIENNGMGEVIAEADNGKVFLEKLNLFKPDLVIMDIEMPVMNGLDATKKALEIYPDLKVLVLTMLSDKENYQEMIQAGAIGFVLKTSGKKEFEKAIQTVMSGESYFSNDLLRQIIFNIDPKASNSVNIDKKASKIKFTLREKEVLMYFCQGLTVSEIADKLFLSPKTIETHRSTLLRKTKAKNTLNLVLLAIKNKMVEI
ncbi:MAG: response regulator transcription factor [Paludibacter sp.]|nr:response regulator transcription factor [Paludibacter sp.]